jgi:NTP pyrophosphatase (non-canonical NTP hydrolase)
MFNELAKEIHEGNASRGFWEGERKLTEVVMLTVCELAEAIEADRAEKWATEQDILQYKNISTPERFKENIKDTVQDEIADAIIRLLDFSHKFNIDLDFHIKAKLDYNASRPYKHGKTY